MRGDVQVANRAILPFEQFGLGGVDSVRGYCQDALLADNGVFTSMEARLPIARFAKDSVLRGTRSATVARVAIGTRSPERYPATISKIVFSRSIPKLIYIPSIEQNLLPSIFKDNVDRLDLESESSANFEIIRLENPSFECHLLI